MHACMHAFVCSHSSLAVSGGLCMLCVARSSSSLSCCHYHFSMRGHLSSSWATVTMHRLRWRQPTLTRTGAGGRRRRCCSWRQKWSRCAGRFSNIHLPLLLEQRLCRSQLALIRSLHLVSVLETQASNSRSHASCGGLHRRVVAGAWGCPLSGWRLAK